ncbi:MAG: serine/threonine-protein kinase [Myxococcota bacterium]
MARSPVAFGSYIITRRIARGGMAEIYRAKSRTQPGWVALKMMRPSLEHEDLREQLFKREAKIAAALNHPNVVGLVEFGKELDRYFIAMEYVRGRDLSQLVRPPSEGGQPVPLEIGLWVGQRAAAGLGHAHRMTDAATGRELGIVHRDISPGNIMVSYSGEVKVLDFGVARMTETHGLRTQTGTLRGKFAYMSPEQTVGAAIDARSDVFSLGTVLYEMLTGTNPFRARTPIATLERVQRVRPVPPSRLVETLPRELDEILAQCLAKDPRRRFKDAGELSDALLRFLERQPPLNPAEIGRFMSERFRWEKQEEERELREEEQGVALIEVVDFALSPELDAPNVAVHEDEEARSGELKPPPEQEVEAEEQALGVFQSAEALTVAQPSPFRDLDEGPERSEPTETRPKVSRMPALPLPKAPGSPPPIGLPPRVFADAKHDTDGLLAALKDDRLQPAPAPAPAPDPAPAPPARTGRRPNPAVALAAVAALLAALGVTVGPRLFGGSRGRARPAPTEIAPITISVSPRPSETTAAAPPPPSAPAPSAAPSVVVPPVELTAQAVPPPPTDAVRDDDDDRDTPGRPRGAKRLRTEPVSGGSSPPAGLQSPRSLRRVAPPPTAAPAPAPSPSGAPAYLNVGAKPWGEIEIDGKPWPYQTPQAGIEVPPGRHVVRLSNKDTGVSKTAVVHLRAGQYKTVNLDLRTP